MRPPHNFALQLSIWALRYSFEQAAFAGRYRSFAQRFCSHCCSHWLQLYWSF
jgi:hypothetical protein